MLGTRLLMVLKGSIIRWLFIGVLIVLTGQMLLKAFGILA
jgi:uncharacterized membrane protein YfcA